MSATWYEVASPLSARVDPVLDDGSGPTDYWRDVLYVRASSAQRAKALFIRAFRRRCGPSAWRKAPWLTDGNPFAGMLVRAAAPSQESEETT